VQLTDRGPRRRRGSVALIRAVRSFGFVLVLSATLASVPLLWFTVQWVTEHVHLDKPLWKWPHSIKVHGFAIWASSLGLTAMWPIGVWMCRYRRRPVLYLRRFGDTDSTGLVSDAVFEIGSSYRMITLDDQSVAPIGHRRRTTFTARVLFALGRGYLHLVGTGNETIGKAIKFFAWCLGISLAILFFTSDGSFGQRISQSVSQHGWFHDVFDAFGIITGILIIIIFARLAGFAAGLATLPASFIVGMAGMQVLETEKWLQKLSVNSAKDLRNGMALIKRYSGRALTVRFSVLKVDSFLWKQTVRAVMEECGLALLDISDITANMLWEIEELESHSTAVVLVGAADKVDDVLYRPTDDFSLMMARELLDGRRVLTYTTDPAGRRTFVRELRASFDSLPRRRAVAGSKSSISRWRVRARTSRGGGV
jgi:hypothetical protein